jgi:hypothetical protein
VANKITRANAGGRRQLPIRTRLAARIAQFCRWAVSRGSIPSNESWGSVAKFSTIAGR